MKNTNPMHLSHDNNIYYPVCMNVQMSQTLTSAISRVDCPECIVIIKKTMPDDYSNQDWVTCVECGVPTKETAGCNNCGITFQVTKQYNIGCYYCGDSMNRTWASSEEFTIGNLTYMLCRDHDETFVLQEQPGADECPNEGGSEA